MVEEINKEVDLITGAHMAAEDLRREREKYEAVLKRMEAFESRQILGGKTTAGETQKRELTAEEKLDLELKRVWKGTALDGVFNK